MITALLFPGQGAQSPGMGREIYDRELEARQCFERASAVLGYDMAALCFEGDAEDLQRSDRAQPAIFTVSMAAWAALRQVYPAWQPGAAAGLSSGEWAALCAAGVLDFEATVRLLEQRGRFMQQACEEQRGGMLVVIGLPVEAVEPLARACGLEVANLNAPDQTVLSGRAERLQEAEQAAAAAGAKRVVTLRVAGAFHSSLMASAAEAMRDCLAGAVLRAPAFPVWSNVTGRPHGGPQSIRSRMVEQITSPVRWVDDIRDMRAAGVGRSIECGPGRVLSGLVKRIDKGVTLLNIQDARSLGKTVAAMNG